MKSIRTLCLSIAAASWSSSSPAQDAAPRLQESFWSKAVGIVSFPFRLFLPRLESRDVLMEKDTALFRVRVEADDSGRRHLVYLPRKGSQTVWDPARPDVLCSNFAAASFLSLAVLGREPRNALFIGLGGGVMPEHLRARFPSAAVDIFEIDPEIPDIARQWFGFKGAGPTKIEIGDGRLLLSKSAVSYDLILIDVYNATGIPFHFTTKEFFELVKKRLTPDGVAAMNLAVLGGEDFIASELKTLASVFPGVLVVECPGGTNFVPLCLSSPPPTNAETKDKAIRIDKGAPAFASMLTDAAEWLLDRKSIDAWLARKEPSLTDDLAPGDHLR